MRSQTDFDHENGQTFTMLQPWADYFLYVPIDELEMYYPIKIELAGKIEHCGHVMVCTGYDYDRMGRLFYEFQESAGVKVCDRGFVRIYADVVHAFTEMKVQH